MNKNELINNLHDTEIKVRQTNDLDYCKTTIEQCNEIQKTITIKSLEDIKLLQQLNKTHSAATSRETELWFKEEKRHIEEERQRIYNLI